MMKAGDICRRVIGVALLVIWHSDTAAAIQLSDPELIAISAVVAAVVLVIAVVVLIICCRRVKRLKKKKGHYHQVHESSTLQSLYPSAKPLPKTFTSNDYSNGKVINGKVTNGKVINGKAVNGKISSGNGQKKIGRSRSDVNDQRLYVVPEWRRQQDMRNGSYVTGVHRSTSNASATSTGIWTSNPTLTRGMYQSYVTVTSTGTDVGQPRRPFGSVPSIPDKRPSTKHRELNHHRVSAPPVVNTATWEKQKSSKLHQPPKNDLTRVEEDTKELLPTSSSEDTSSDRDHQIVARAYSNPAYLKDPDESGSTGRSVGQESPFIAKVYSDYQLPKDCIRSPRSDQEQHTVVAKAYSNSIAEVKGVKRVTDIKRHSSSPTKLAGVHVARAVVRHSSSLDSNGEPRYARPQDALDVITYKDAGGGTTPGEKNVKRLGRSRSGKDKKGKDKKSRHSTGQMISKHGKRGSFNVSQSSADFEGYIHDSYEDVVYMPNGSHSRLISPSNSNKQSKQRLWKSKQKASTSAEKTKKKDEASGSYTKNHNNLFLKIDGHRVEPNPEGVVRSLPSVATSMGDSGSDRREESTEPPSENSDRSSTVEPISESSSVRESAAANDTQKSLDANGTAPALDDPNAIYSAPIKRERRQSGETKPELIVDDSPLTPMPPPVPPVTELREEPLSPAPPPVPPITKLREEPLTTSINAALPVTQLDEKPITTASPVTQLEEKPKLTTPISVRQAARLMEDPRTPLPSPSIAAKNRNNNDGDGISTGKNVIGDAFKFLEDFDDLSLDAEDRL